MRSGGPITISQKEQSFSATVLTTDRRRDLALLRVAALPLAAVKVAPTRELKVGAKVYAVGAPRGLELTLSDGIVSALRDANESPTETEPKRGEKPSQPGAMDLIVGRLEYRRRSDGNSTSGAPGVKTWLVQTTVPISPGSSGGGLFDDRARLVGIVTSGSSAARA